MHTATNADSKMMNKTMNIRRRLYREKQRLLIRKLTFQRLVKEVATEICPGFRFQSTAVLMLQECAEAYITQYLLTRCTKINAI
jgi:histone H3/H4